MTTVWIYVDTNKEVGNVDHLKVFATPELAGRWLRLPATTFIITHSPSRLAIMMC